MTRNILSTSFLRRAASLLTHSGRLAAMLAAAMCGMSMHMSAQSLLQRLDRQLAERYRKGNIDTAYVVRPQTRWTVRARLNVSGAEIGTEGIDRSAVAPGSSADGQHYVSEMEANRKTTLSLGVSYLGLSLSASLKPSKTSGTVSDYELNLNSYGRRFGFDIIYQDAKNFTGHYDQDGMERLELPDGMLKVQTLNLNAYYAFNSRRFSYPAAFSQSYIQRRSAGSFLLGASGMSQNATFGGDQEMQLKMNNVGIGAGYGYNFVPSRGWLLHISSLPTFIVYSKATMDVGDERMTLRYHFPEVIITGRGAVVYQWGNKFMGLSSVFNYTNIGSEDNFAVYNTNWRVRAFFGLRL